MHTLVLYSGILVEGKFDFINGWVFYFSLKKILKFKNFIFFENILPHFIFVELYGNKAK